MEAPPLPNVPLEAILPLLVMGLQKSLGERIGATPAVCLIVGVPQGDQTTIHVSGNLTLDQAAGLLEDARTQILESIAAEGKRGPLQ